MINFSTIEFIKSAPSIKDAPKGQFKEVLIIGKSNVGKSTLINALSNRKQLAFTSSKPGHTRILNYYLVDQRFYLVDAPGYGYAKGGIDLDVLFAEMMEEYFEKATFLKLVLLLIDSRREISENDAQMIEFLKAKNIDFIIVMTKADKINQSEKSKALKRIKEFGELEDKAIFVSSLEQKTLVPLKKAIEKYI